MRCPKSYSGIPPVPVMVPFHVVPLSWPSDSFQRRQFGWWLVGAWVMGFLGIAHQQRARKGCGVCTVTGNHLQGFTGRTV